MRSVLRMVAPPCGLREVLTGLRLLCKLWELRDKSEVRQALHAADVHVVLVNRVLDIGLDPPVESLAVLQLALQCLILMYVRACSWLRGSPPASWGHASLGFCVMWVRRRLDTSFPIQTELAGRFLPILPRMLLEMLHRATTESGLGSAGGFVGDIADTAHVSVWTCAAKAAVLLGCLCRAPANQSTRDLVFSSSTAVPDALWLVDKCVVPAAKAGAAWLLGTLMRASPPSRQRQFLEAHPEAVGLLVRSMQSSDLVVCEAAGCAMQALLRQCRPAQEAALGAGLLPVLVGLIGSYRTSRMTTALQVLDKLCWRWAVAQDAVRAWHGGALLRCVIGLLDDEDKALAHEAAGALFSIIAHNPDNKSFVGEERDGAGLASLVTLLRTCMGAPGVPLGPAVTPDKARQRFAWAEQALHTLAAAVCKHAGNCSRLVAFGDKLRVVLLQDLARMMQRRCAQCFLDACCVMVALTRASTDWRVRAQIGAVGLVQVLVNALTPVGPRDMCVAAAFVLGELMGGSEGVVDLVVALGGQVALAFLLLPRGAPDGVAADACETSLLQLSCDMFGVPAIATSVQAAVTLRVLTSLAILLRGGHRARVTADVKALPGFMEALDTFRAPACTHAPTLAVAHEVVALLG